jgi:Domain of unknown function (DUF4386)
MITTVTNQPAPDSTTATWTPIPRALWGIAGSLALGHLALLLAGISQEKSPLLTDSPNVVKQTFLDSNVTRVLAGGYVEALSFIVLLPVVIFLGRAVGQRTEAGRWAARTAAAAGICYVAITLATAMPAGAAALYGAHHGVTSATTLYAIDNMRNFAFYVSVLALGAQALSIGIAAVSDGLMRRWIGVGGIVVGVAMLAGVAAQSTDAVNLVFIPWMVWWGGLGIVLIKRGFSEGHDA